MPKDLEQMLRSGAVRRDHARLDATPFGKSLADQTAARVSLSRAALPKGADAFGALANALKKHQAQGPGSKVVVFCPTTAAAELAAAYLRRRDVPNSALHSRKTQSYRTRVSNEFRDADPDAEHAVLVATDVAARGVDYPGVSLVVQLNAPDNREQFVHRAGRTGRAGKAGAALILLEHWEEAYAMDMLGDVPDLETLDAHTLLPVGPDLDASKDAMRAIPKDLRDKFYVAWLGHTNAKAKALGWSKQRLVDEANANALSDLLLKDIPSITPRAVGFMGLKQVKNIVVMARPRASNNKPGHGNGRGQRNKPRRPH